MVHTINRQNEGGSENKGFFKQGLEGWGMVFRKLKDARGKANAPVERTG